MVYCWAVHRVTVQIAAERLRRCAEVRVATAAGIDCEDRGPGKTEDVVPLERLGDCSMHVTELGAVALVEDQDDVAAVNRMTLVGADERRELLDRSDDDLRARIFELLLQHGRRGVRVCSTLLKAVVLAHGLIVEVFAIYNEQHLVHAR